MSQDYIALVNQIPVDQTAPANYPIKKFLLEKIQLIFRNKNIIEKAKIEQKKKEILDAYKKNVGFEKKLKTLLDAKAKLEAAEKDLMEAGLSPLGKLLSVSDDKTVYGQKRPTLLWENAWIEASAETVEKVKKVQELIKAVEGEMQPYTMFDQLETRMMLASSVGEAMAIINAIAGEEVFKVKTDLLQLTEKTTKK